MLSGAFLFHQNPLHICRFVKQCVLSTPFIEVLHAFHADKCSAVPIVDNAGKMIAVVTKSDIRGLVKPGIWASLNQTVGELLAYGIWIVFFFFLTFPHSYRYRGKAPDILPRVISRHDTLEMAMTKLVGRDVYRLFLIDQSQRIVGKITLTKFMRYLLSV